jgi:hypothetical protein
MAPPDAALLLICGLLCMLLAGLPGDREAAKNGRRRADPHAP